MISRDVDAHVVQSLVLAEPRIQVFDFYADTHA
jgi:hypothetical protein